MRKLFKEIKLRFFLNRILSLKTVFVAQFKIPKKPIDEVLVTKFHCYLGNNINKFNFIFSFLLCIYYAH